MENINIQSLKNVSLDLNLLKLVSILQILLIIGLFIFPKILTYISTSKNEIIIGFGFWYILLIYLTFFSRKVKTLKHLKKGLNFYFKNDLINAFKSFEKAKFQMTFTKNYKARSLLIDWCDLLEQKII